MGLKQEDRAREETGLTEALAQDLGESVREIRQGVKNIELGPPWQGLVYERDD